MRRFGMERAGGPALGLAVLLGAASPSAGDNPPNPKITLKVEQTVGDMAYVPPISDMSVEGIGLVLGLDDTGSDPPPGLYRDQILTEMRKARVEDPEQILESGRAAVVVVRAKIPAGITPEDPIDVEVEPAPGTSTKSLVGGNLIKVELKQVLRTERGQLGGQVKGFAWGPIMPDPDQPTRGRILGGGRAKEEVPFQLIIRENYQAAKSAKLLEMTINGRFHQSTDGERKGMAVAKDHRYLELKVPAAYHQNQPRYFQLIRLLPLLTQTARGPELEQRLMARWEKELLNPQTAGMAALRLEGCGGNAIPVLKKGLESADPTIRFFAAEALAYLHDHSGVEVLAQVAKDRREFRAFALAALAASDHSAGLMRLRRLMDESDPELRYGAFNALRAADPHAPDLGRIPLFDLPPEDEGDEDDLALQITNVPKKRGPQRPKDTFDLYVIPSDGPPLLHASRSRRSEIVIFGAGQRLLTPIVLGAGSSITLNAAEEDKQVQISRIASNSAGQVGEMRRLITPSLVEVIRSSAQLGATYPEILSMLEAASRQQNLQGSLVLDAVPAANPAYERAQLAGTKPEGKPKKDMELKTTGGIAEEKGTKKAPAFPRIRNPFGKKGPEADAPENPPAASSTDDPAKRPFLDRMLRPLKRRDDR